LTKYPSEGAELENTKSETANKFKWQYGEIFQ
jgi:hypothetical protein